MTTDRVTTDRTQPTTPAREVPYGTADLDPAEKSVDLRAWVRPHVEPDTPTRKPNRPVGQGSTRVGWALVFDTETTTDTAQQLNFGAYRIVYRGNNNHVSTVEEGVFYADNLPTRDPAGYATLVGHTATLRPDVTGGTVGPPGQRVPCESGFTVMSRREWVESVMFRCLRMGAVVVGFNLPFDLSRVAVGASPGIGENYGAFSLKLWDLEGFRPHIIIRNLDSRKSLISTTGIKPQPPGWRTPRFLDLRTLTSAVTGGGYSVKSACEKWEVEHGKTEINEHGVITPEYIDYCRRDVQATGELLGKVLQGFESYRVPNLGADRALSGASLAKATLRGLGLKSPLERNPGFPDEMLGASMEAFYGGRSEVRTRRVHVPAEVHDFTSMYPTVNALTGLWGLLTADTITADEDTDRVRDLIDRVTVQDCYRPETWRDLVGVAQILADGDVLPVRAAFERGESPVIGLQPVHSDRPTWYTIADLVASRILTGRVPTIVRAVTFTGHGIAKDLKDSQLATLTVDPTVGDMFKKVIELRKAPGNTKTTSTFLKLFANSGSYGIFSEFVVKPHAEQQVMDVTTGNDSFESSTTATEVPGAWCFPPIAATITGAARLMLALLEKTVIDEGGWWAFCDTDSMAIIVDDSGALIPCPGGQYRDSAGNECVRALTPDRTAVIRERFDMLLNPYDRDVIPHLLKHEYTAIIYAVSAKRYATYRIGEKGKVVTYSEKDAVGNSVEHQMVDSGGEVTHVVNNDGEKVDLGKQHGVGYLLAPDLDRDDLDSPLDTTDRDWIDALWRTVIERDLGLPETDARVRAWRNLPAIMRVSVTSPHMLNRVRTLNEGKDWDDQVKPFNFMSMLTSDEIGMKQGALVGPYIGNNRNVRDQEWTDIKSGETHLVGIVDIDTLNSDQEPSLEEIADMTGRTAVRNFDTVVRRHDRSVESKYRAPGGGPCTQETRGVLLRRPVQSRWHRYIGKEVPTLDETEQIADGLEVGVFGGDDEWTQVLPTLRELGVRRIRAELDRTGYLHGHVDKVRTQWDTVTQRNVGEADLMRQRIHDAPNAATRKRWTGKLAEWEAGKVRRHRELDKTEPRITDRQLRRVLNQTTTKPRANVRERLTRLSREHLRRIELETRATTP